MTLRFDSWESYFYPETFDPVTGNGTLKNLLDEHNATVLARREYVRTSVRTHQIGTGAVAIARTYDAAHVRAIHGYLFQDVYEGAGQYRTVNITKDISTFADVRSGQVDRYLADMHRIVSDTPWARLDRDTFAERAASVFAYFNQAHPFREGNGRTGKVLMEHVAELSQFTLDFARVTPEVWNNASMLSGPDLGGYEPVPDSLVPVFRVVAQPRKSGSPTSRPSNPGSNNLLS